MRTWKLTLALLLSIAASPAAFSFQEPVNQQGPICNPLCITSECSSNSDCTAEPNGRCDFACPQTGCCVYN